MKKTMRFTMKIVTAIRKKASIMKKAIEVTLKIVTSYWSKKQV